MAGRHGFGPSPLSEAHDFELSAYSGAVKFLFDSNLGGHEPKQMRGLLDRPRQQYWPAWRHATLPG